MTTEPSVVEWVALAVCLALYGGGRLVKPTRPESGEFPPFGPIVTSLIYAIAVVPALALTVAFLVSNPPLLTMGWFLGLLYVGPNMLAPVALLIVSLGNQSGPVWNDCEERTMRFVRRATGATCFAMVLVAVIVLMTGGDPRLAGAVPLAVGYGAFLALWTIESWWDLLHPGSS